MLDKVLVSVKLMNDVSDAITCFVLQLLELLDGVLQLYLRVRKSLLKLNETFLLPLGEALLFFHLLLEILDLCAVLIDSFKSFVDIKLLHHLLNSGFHVFLSDSAAARMHRILV